MTKRDAPSLPRQATEPRRLRRLPWPRNLFGELATIEELMAEDVNHTDRCASGCLKQYGHNVSQTQSIPYGFSVIWFWSDACKSRCNRDWTRE